MTNFKHFSFDLWLTLIRSNPAFKKERALYFHQKFNPLKKTVAEVEMIFREVDLMCNAVNEKSGKNIDADEMYLMVIYKLGNVTETIQAIDFSSLYREMEILFFSYSPVIYHPETINCLHRIKENSDNTLNILSNTGFVRGSTLRVLLDELTLSGFFNFQIYSDEVGISKPNAEIYTLLLKNIHIARQNGQTGVSDIIHIGDNPIADIAGAQAAGINAFQINSNNKNITDLFN